MVFNTLNQVERLEFVNKYHEQVFEDLFEATLIYFSKTQGESAPLSDKDIEQFLNNRPAMLGFLTFLVHIAGTASQHIDNKLSFDTLYSLASSAARSFVESLKAQTSKDGFTLRQLLVQGLVALNEQKKAN